MTFKSERTAIVGAFVAAAVAVTLSAPAWSKDFCAVHKSQWQPTSSLVKKLEVQGWKIRNMKVDSGCYEVYGTDGNGKLRETHFNPATLQEVAEGHKG